ncbi:MAG: ABC transporter permease [Rhodospirillales bacterium]
MLAFIIRRLLQAALVIVIMSGLVFVGIYLIGNPVYILISPEASELERAQVIHNLGLDLPLWQQYLVFVEQALGGSFGKSFVFGEPAMKIVLERVPATAELALFSTFLALFVGVPLGIWAGLKPNAISSRGIMAGSILGFSLPNFWVGLMLIMLFGVWLRNSEWLSFLSLPASGRGETVTFLGTRLSIFTIDGWRHLLLPAFTLGLSYMALNIRLTRAGVREVLLQDYVKFARAKGLPERRVIGVHVLKNILIPIVTVTGLELGTVIAFAVVTETVFAWPGMGKLLIDSIVSLDRPVVVAYLMTVVGLLVVLNLVVDVLYSVIDPRIRLGGRSE